MENSETEELSPPPPDPPPTLPTPAMTPTNTQQSESDATSVRRSTRRRVTPVKHRNESESSSALPSQSSQASTLRAPAEKSKSTRLSESDAPLARKSARRGATPMKYREESDSPSVSSAKSTPKQKLQPLRGNWSANHLLTNSKSKLATVNLPDLLSQERAWTELTRDEQLELISLLPGATVPDSGDPTAPLPNIPRQFLKNNSSFLSDIRFFQEDLSLGRYDPVWLRDAQNAMEKRARGDFDAWKEKNREEFWGQKQKIDWNAIAGESSQHSLTTLVQAGYIEVGDIWIFRASQTKTDENEQKEVVLVEKEAKVTAISESHALSFTFPPGTHKFSSPANGEDVSVEGVTSPATIHDAIMTKDGRLAGVRRGNTWRDFRCLRKNQDMGSLWDIRELYHHRQSRNE